MTIVESDLRRRRVRQYRWDAQSHWEHPRPDGLQRGTPGSRTTLSGLALDGEP